MSGFTKWAADDLMVPPCAEIFVSIQTSRSGCCGGEVERDEPSGSSLVENRRRFTLQRTWGSNVSSLRESRRTPTAMRRSGGVAAVRRQRLGPHSPAGNSMLALVHSTLVSVLVRSRCVGVRRETGSVSRVTAGRAVARQQEDESDGPR